MALVASRIRRAQSPLRQTKDSLQRLLVSHGDLSHAEVQAVGTRVTEVVKQTLEAVVESSALPPDVQGWIEPKGGHIQCTFWSRPYHSLKEGGAFKFGFRIKEPVGVEVEITPIVGVADDEADRFTFIVIDANRHGTEPLRLRLEDVHPALTVVAENLLEEWMHTALAPVFAELDRGLSSSLRSAGYQ